MSAPKQIDKLLESLDDPDRRALQEVVQRVFPNREPGVPHPQTKLYASHRAAMERLANPYRFA